MMGRRMSGRRRRAYRRRWRLAAAAVLVLALAGCGVHWLRGHVRLAWNETGSLPHALFLVRLGTAPDRGDYVLFDPPEQTGSRYPFVKRVAGVAGDTVAVTDREVTVGGLAIGKAKMVSRRGEPLDPIASGVIPPGFYFLHADHEDSYDSRYQSIGLVPDARILGRAVPLF